MESMNLIEKFSKRIEEYITKPLSTVDILKMMIRSKLLRISKLLTCGRPFSASIRPSDDPRMKIREPDPFGLSDSDVEVTLGVKGLYSKVDPISFPLTTHAPEATRNDDPTDVYKGWLDESTTKRRNSKLTSDSELVRNASFGTIRFDTENPPREVQEENDDSHLSASAEANEPSPGRYKRVKKNYEELSQSNSSENETSTTVDLKKTTKDLKQKGQTVVASVVIPSVYEMQSLNDLTHYELWTLLRSLVVFQNDFILAINKPYGLPMHTPSLDCRHTVLDFLNELTTFCKSSETVQPVHRLDKDTTGVMLLAKNQMAATVIKGKFASRHMRKKYLAITKNCPPMQTGTIEIPISEGKIGATGAYRSVLKPDLRQYKISSSQDGSKTAVTHFQVIGSTKDCAFLEVRPETGVKHQIRVHLSMGLGCPILGDHKYSHREKLAPQRLSPEVLGHLSIKQSKVRHLPLHLHCSTIEFNMPEGFSKNEEPVFAHARPPKHFMHTLRRLQLK